MIVAHCIVDLRFSGSPEKDKLTQSEALAMIKSYRHGSILVYVPDRIGLRTRLAKDVIIHSRIGSFFASTAIVPASSKVLLNGVLFSGL